MAVFQLCNRDPLVSLLHDIFGANIVRVPDSRVRPLAVITHCDRRSIFRGKLAPLLEGEEPLEIDITTSYVANISGRRSRRVNLDLGIYILKGFLSGLGIPSAGIASVIQGAAAFTFAFPTVQRSSVDINILGRILTGRSIDRDNPAASVYFADPGAELLIIDSVLTSRSIAVHVSSARRRELALDVEGLHQLVAGSGGRAAVAVGEQGELTFESDRDLAFAFSCVRMFIDDEGCITALPPDLRVRTLGSTPALNIPRVRYSPDRVLLSDEPGLLMWDN